MAHAALDGAGRPSSCPLAALAKGGRTHLPPLQRAAGLAAYKAQPAPLRSPFPPNLSTSKKKKGEGGEKKRRGEALPVSNFDFR